MLNPLATKPIVFLSNPMGALIIASITIGLALLATGKGTEGSGFIVLSGVLVAAR